jgi:uncharacterized protein YndB with AHSA1/START domain
MADQIGEVLARGARREVVLTRTFAAPPADVWAALTRPERVARWIGDLETDGTTYTLTFPAHGGVTTHGRVLVCVPDERLVVSWTHEAEAPGEVEVQVAPQDGGSVLRLVHRDVQAVGASVYGAGWHDALADLAAAVGEQRAAPSFDELLPRYRRAEARAVAGRTQERPDGWVVDVSRLLDAPVEDVWAAFTRRDRVARWLWPVAHWPVADDSPWEPAVGDRIVFDDPNLDAGQVFEVLDVEAPRRLVVTFGPEGSTTTVTFTLEAQPDSTLLSVHQSATPGVVAAGQEHVGPDFAAGWHALVDVLSTVLAGQEAPETGELWEAAHAVYVEGA